MSRSYCRHQRSALACQGHSTHVLLLLRALLAVVGVRRADAAANDTAAMVGAVVALVTDVHQRRWADVAVADDALAVALVAKPPNRCRDKGVDAVGGRVGVATESSRPRAELCTRYVCVCALGLD